MAALLLKKLIGCILCMLSALVALGALIAASCLFSVAGIQSAARAAQADAASSASKISSRKFDDWYYRCSGPTGAGECEVAQVAQVPKDGKSVNVLSLAIARPAVGDSDPKGQKGSLTLTVLLPLNVYLPAGVSISANGRSILKLDYRNCNQMGCWAQHAFDPKAMSALRKVATAEAQVLLMDEKPVSIRFSTKGLGPALDELKNSAFRQ